MSSRNIFDDGGAQKEESGACTLEKISTVQLHIFVLYLPHILGRSILGRSFLGWMTEVWAQSAFSFLEDYEGPTVPEVGSRSENEGNKRN